MSVLGSPVPALASAGPAPTGPKVDQGEFVGEGGGRYQDFVSGRVDAGNVGDGGADEARGGSCAVGLLGWQGELGSDEENKECPVFHGGFSDVL